MKIAIAILFCAVSVMAEQTVSVYRTQGTPNGRAWLVMTATEKLTWVGAFNEGVMFARSLVPPNGPGRKEIDDNLVCPLTLGEIRAALDHFYDDTPENGPIPVNEAWVVMTMRAQGGASSVEIENITAKFRAAFATTK